MTQPTVDLRFPHAWQAEILGSRPLILPPRRFVYPAQAEEVERGALEVLVRPDAPVDPQTDPKCPPSAQEFLATCALGFADPAVPSGLWSCPNPNQLCAVSGGYAYLIDTAQPGRFTFLPFRPVLTVRAVPEAGLLLFAGHHALLAWGRAGLAWQMEKLSDEGLTITSIEGSTLRGLGWQMMTDRETEFALDLTTGHQLSQPFGSNTVASKTKEKR